jgi:hypothetical protein
MALAAGGTWFAALEADGTAALELRGGGTVALAASVGDELASGEGSAPGAELGLSAGASEVGRRCSAHPTKSSASKRWVARTRAEPYIAPL